MDFTNMVFNMISTSCMLLGISKTGHLYMKDIQSMKGIIS